MSVEAAVASAQTDRDFQDLEEKVDWNDRGGFTKKQQALVESQKKKYDARKAQAYLDGALVDAEATTDVKEQAAQELLARKRRAADRHAKQRRVRAATMKAPFNVRAVQGKRCFIHGDIDSPGLRAMLSQKQCVVVANRPDADVFITGNPSLLGCRSTWTAVLKGSFVVTPAALKGNGRGAVIKYKSALSVRRLVHMTPQFRERHPEVAKLIFDLGKDNSTWQFSKSLEDQLRFPVAHHPLPCISA